MSSADNRQWIAVSDMMTGLMMVFLFVSVVFMQQISSEQRAVEDIAVTYKQTQDELNVALLQEFKDDLSQWNAEVLGDNTLRFNEPDVLFDTGSNIVKTRFSEILSDFFPRYVRLLGSKKFRNNIEEIRIEGHTSSTWEGSKDLETRYLSNAQLSQQRSFAILEYCYKLPQIVPYQEWLTKVIRANGLAFANPIMRAGQEDMDRSRRVEFRVKTKAEERIRDIVDTIKKSNV